VNDGGGWRRGFADECDYGVNADGLRDADELMVAEVDVLA
jgi:hypothetical protein